MSSSPVGRALSTVDGGFDMERDLEGAGGAEGESSLQAALAASRRAEAKSAQELQLELEAVRLRLLRRSQIIDALRSAYVRDVVIIKNELMRKSSMTDEEYAAQGGPGTDVTDAIPSLDMRPVLALFSPEDAFLRIESCSGCGGHLEIVTKETKRVARLTKRISELTEQMGESAKEAAHLRAELILTRHRVKELDERNMVNRDTLVAKLEQTQRTCEADVLALQESARRSNRAWEGKLARKDEQLAVIPVLHEERDMLREALSEERASREEDLHNKDGEIATLKAKVAHLESSAEADAKVLLEARNKIDEVQRRLKAEKGEHVTTTGLLEEERARYERCRARLETSQEHLADLNDRFNELRAEVESSAENAEEEAGEASDALAAAKMEIQRLRGVLGTNDAAAALETATAKVSSLSEELHAARSEARQANEALQEAQEELQTVQAELEKAKAARMSMVSMRSAATRESDGGLSWAGSFVGTIDDEDLLDEERQDRMSSAMIPGSGKFEKGKWAVEKWVALVRFRKAVNAHNTEVARLLSLLHAAQGGEERTRLASELEQVSNRFSLENMEDAMHREVASLKQQAGGGGGGERPDPPTSVAVNMNKFDDAEWEAMLNEQQERHETVVEGLRAELSKHTAEIDRLEAEAGEMKEKLKKLEKLEKSQKGHDAMTEELKKMEEETGLDVGLESSLEFTSIEGDLSKDDEARLIEELENAREEIKNIKMRQAMVTHELLGTIKGTNAEVDMLKAALIDMTAQRDARMDMSMLARQQGGSGLSAPEAEELKEEAKLHKKKAAALKVKLQETSEALLELLEEMRKSAKETVRAKTKVWNQRELDRARSIPPPPKNSIAVSGRASIASQRLSTAGQRPSIANAGNGGAGGGGGGSSRKVSSVGGGGVGSAGAQSSSAPPALPVVSIHLPGNLSDGPVDSKEKERGSTEGGGGGGGKGTTAGEEGEDKEAELERRRQDRAAQIAAKKRQAEEEQRELEEFRDACQLPQSEGVAYAVEKMAAVQADVKQQFKEIFLELRESLEAHKKFVMRTRVETREVTGKMAVLETELRRLRGLLNTTEEQLREKTTVLGQTQAELTSEKNAGAATRTELAAAQTEARENVFFRQKNAVLQKQIDRAEISSRRAKQETEKAKRELAEQAANVMELRKRAEESDRKTIAFIEAEGALKDEIEKLTELLGEAESTIESMERARRARLEALTSTACQVNGNNDPDLGIGVQGSTQTDFHCPGLTLRRGNQRTFPARASSAGTGARFEGSISPFLRDGSISPGGFVYPAVDGRAAAAERDLYSPGTGSAEFLEIQQNPSTVQSFGGSTGSIGSRHVDAGSDSLKQLSLRSSRSWAVPGGGTEPSLCRAGGPLGEGETIFEGADGDTASSPPPQRQQQQHAEAGGQAKNWGLWHEGGDVDCSDGGDVRAPRGASPGPEVEQDESSDLPGTIAGATGAQRPGTMSHCARNTSKETPQEPQNRPQTSPSVALSAPERHRRGSGGGGGGGGGDDDEYDDGGREGSKSPSRRMRSRIFAQSARDLSLSPLGGGGGGRPGGPPAVRRARTSHLNSSSCSAFFGGGGGEARLPRGTASKRPSTSSAVLTGDRSSGGGGGDWGGLTKERPSSWSSVLGDRDGPDYAAGGVGGLIARRGAAEKQANHQVIDLGVVSDPAPRPTVWGERQMAAAAAAAAGKASRGGGSAKAGVTKGGVLIDARFAKLRKTLRADVLEAAERSKLPLLLQ